jgi:MFS family permease
MLNTGAKSLSSLMVALVLFGLAGSAVMVTAPGLFAGPVRPEFTVFLVAGVAAIVLTAGFFGYIYRLGMGFGRTVLVLAAGYNALIAAVKLGLAPAALYQANREQAFDAAFGDPNDLWFYLGVGSGILLLYLLVFGVMYSVFRRRFRRRALPSEPPPEQSGRWSNRTIVVGVVVLVAFAASFLWIMPLVYVGFPTFSYLFYTFSTFGAAIALALVLAAVLAYRSFDEVEKRAVRLGDATLLASFFWLGLALILLYHVMWVVFLLTLVSIWPFQTYTPK